MGSSLFQRKSIDKILREAGDSEHGLHRSLTALNLILLGVGGIIGAGIFVLTGHAAAEHAGPAIVISFLLSGIACVFAAFCYSELAAMIPIAGSAYTYAYATLGQFIAWIIGWDLILEYLFGASAVAVGWSGYFVKLLKDFGITFPAAFANAPLDYKTGEGWIFTGATLNLPAAVIIGFMTYLLVLGIRESARFNNLIVIIKITVLLLFLVFGSQYISTSNWHPFIPENTGEYGKFGWSGIFTGADVIFFAYIGFDCLSTLAQETKNPQRDMPIGIFGSLAIVTIFYITVSLVMTGMVHYSKLAGPDPVAVAVDAAGDGLRWLRPFVKVGVVAGLSAVILVLLMGQPRIFYAMANDGLLPKAFAKIHPKYHTPYIPTILTGVVAGIVAGLFPIGILGELVSIGTLLAFVIVCVGVLVLRYTDPDIHRPFRTPYVIPVSILGAGGALFQMYSLPLDTWIRLVVWMAIGFLVYFAYGARHSKISAGS